MIHSYITFIWRIEMDISNSALNSVQTANYLGISTRKLGTLARSGKIPSYKAGRSRRFIPASVDAFRNELQTMEQRKYSRYLPKIASTFQWIFRRPSLEVFMTRMKSQNICGSKKHLRSKGPGSIYKKNGGKGSWRMSFIDLDGKRIDLSTGTKDKKLAHQILATKFVPFAS